MVLTRLRRSAKAVQKIFGFRRLWLAIFAGFSLPWNQASGGVASVTLGSSEMAVSPALSASDVTSVTGGFKSLFTVASDTPSALAVARWLASIACSRSAFADLSGVILAETASFRFFCSAFADFVQPRIYPKSPHRDVCFAWTCFAPVRIYPNVVSQMGQTRTITLRKTATLVRTLSHLGQ